MDRKKYKIIALLLAITVMVSNFTYVGNGERVSAAIKTESNSVSRGASKASSGSAIDDPDADIIDISIKQKGSKSVELKWESYEGAVKYIVFYAKGKSTDYKQSNNMADTQMKMKISRGIKYTFCVVAFSEDDNVLAKTKKISICIPRKNSVRFTRLSSKKVKINWNKSIGANKYIVYKKTNNSKYKVLVKTKKLKFIDKKVSSGKKYRYYVKALNTKNNNIYSTVSSTKRFVIANFVSAGHQKYSYYEMSRDVKSIANSYSDYVKVKILGKSNDNRNIYDVVLGNPKAKKSMLVVCNLHAREYMTSQLSMAQIEYYLKHYNGTIKGVKVKSVLNKIAIHYVPMSNPDGTTISQFGISKIRDKKLRAALYKMPGAGSPSVWKANARGVDLNKNFDYNHYANYGGRRGTSGFAGRRAESEPEAKAIARLVRKLKKTTKLKGVVNYHAMGSIVFGDAVGKTKGVTRKMYSLARGITGYASSGSYGSGKKSVGSFREYVMYKMGIPSITLEIGVGGCPLPSSQFGSIWRRNYNLVIREARLLI